MTWRFWRRALVAIAAITAILVSACQPPEESPTAEDPLAGIVVGCGTIPLAACRRAATAVVAFVPDGARPFDIQVVLNGCPNEGPCPPTPEARKGSVILEFEGGRDPLTFFLDRPAPRNDPITGSFSGPIAPRSARVSGSGPFPFELGHCGFIHEIDFDGSFWVPIGAFDGDAPAAINAEAGTMRLLGLNIAEFTGASGFQARLARFPGEKRFFVCH